MSDEQGTRLDMIQATRIALAQMEFQEQFRKWLNERCKEGIKSDNPAEQRFCGELVTNWNYLFETILEPSFAETEEQS